MKNKKLLKILIPAVILIVVSASVAFIGLKYSKLNPVRLGYFHGGRTMLVYRAYINHEFDAAKIPVDLYTQDLGGQGLYKVSKNYQDIAKNNDFGKITGEALIDQMLAGKLDGAMVGESSFISAVNDGKPVVAVAMLGHDLKGEPAHAILIRKGLDIKSPKDLKGKTLATRRAGEGDATFLKEFLIQSGLTPGKDVFIKEQLDDNEWMKGLAAGDFDGGYYHEMAVNALVGSGTAYIYRRLDWVNPEMSQALLVFSKSYLENHREEVSKIIQVYMKRINYEHNLPESVRLSDPSGGGKAGLQMEEHFQGMNFPQYNLPPLVSAPLLTSMQDLLLKHGAIGSKIDLTPFIDNSFVNAIAKNNNW